MDATRRKRKHETLKLSCLDFDMDGTPDNISFMIKRIKVHTQDALADPTYRFPGNYGVEKFLEIFSGEDNFVSATVTKVSQSKSMSTK